MPSEKTLHKKQQIVEDLAEQLRSSISGVIVDYQGINVAHDTALRKELREAGVKYSVVKNTLLLRASEMVGLDALKDVLSGSTAIATSDSDHVAPAKIIAGYTSKKNKAKNYKVKAGFIDGAVISAEQVDALAKLPSKEELVAKALGGLNAPITGLVYVLDANITGLARVLGAIAEQKTA